jgi:hypothetical protein
MFAGAKIAKSISQKVGLLSLRGDGVCEYGVRTSKLLHSQTPALLLKTAPFLFANLRVGKKDIALSSLFPGRPSAPLIP